MAAIFTTLYVGVGARNETFDVTGGPFYIDGGEGSDRIVFEAPGLGFDTVTDCEDGLDLVFVPSASYGTREAAVAGAVQSGANVVIPLGGSSVTLLDVSLAQISIQDVYLV